MSRLNDSIIPYRQQCVKVELASTEWLKSFPIIIILITIDNSIIIDFYQLISEIDIHQWLILITIDYWLTTPGLKIFIMHYTPVMFLVRSHLKSWLIISF